MQRAIHGWLILLFLATPLFAAEPDPRFQPDPAGARQARLAVDKVVTSTYQRILSSHRYTAARLTNAPVSGKTGKRGRHLLSFAAFNGFTRLALWGLNNGAEINRGDKDRATMLRMAMGNFNVEMARFALDHGANPNMQMGKGDDTLFGGMVKWEWPLAGFQLAKDYKARPVDETERENVLSYIQQKLSGADAELVNYISSVPIIEVPVARAESGDLIDTDMVVEMDQAILAAMDGPGRKLSEWHMRHFFIQGKGFEAFLAFNGFFNSLRERLVTMDIRLSADVINRPDREGNDLLVATIKSLNTKAVETVLSLNHDTVNNMIDDKPHYYSGGKRPLHIAIQWQVPVEIFQRLIDYGADPKLPSKDGRTPLELLDIYRYYNTFDDSYYQAVRALLLPAEHKRDEL